MVLPAFVAPLVPLVLLYGRLTKTFRKVIRQVKRLDNISRTPVVSHVQAAAEGLATVRAFGATPRFVGRSRALADENTRAFFCFYMCNRWIGFRLDFITMSICVCTALICVFARRSITPALAALTLIYSLQMAGVFQFATRLISETEAQFTSVERLLVFSTGVPVEAPAVVGDGPGKAWPARGEVAFRGYSARYREGSPLVLRDVSFEKPFLAADAD